MTSDPYRPASVLGEVLHEVVIPDARAWRATTTPKRACGAIDAAFDVLDEMIKIMPPDPNPWPSQKAKR